MTNVSDNGLINLRSDHSVAATLAALEDVIRCRGLSIVAQIDHARAATNAGLVMRPTQLLIFGNAALGTPLMSVSPTVAIDLPLKGLAWEDASGCVWLSYNDPRYLQQRHRFPEQLLQNINGIGPMCEEAVHRKKS